MFLRFAIISVIFSLFSRTTSSIFCVSFLEFESIPLKSSCVSMSPNVLLNISSALSSFKPSSVAKSPISSRGRGSLPIRAGLPSLINSPLCPGVISIYFSPNKPSIKIFTTLSDLILVSPVSHNVTSTLVFLSSAYIILISSTLPTSAPASRTGTPTPMPLIKLKCTFIL